MNARLTLLLSLTVSAAASLLVTCPPTPKLIQQVKSQPFIGPRGRDQPSPNANNSPLDFRPPVRTSSDTGHDNKATPNAVNTSFVYHPDGETENSSPNRTNSTSATTVSLAYRQRLDRRLYDSRQTLSRVPATERGLAWRLEDFHSSSCIATINIRDQETEWAQTPITCVAMSHDDKQLAISSGGTVSLIDLPATQVTERRESHNGDIVSIAYSDNSTSLYVLHETGRLSKWSVPTLEQLWTIHPPLETPHLHVPSGPINLPSRPGNAAFAIGETLHVVDGESGDILNRLDLEVPITGLKAFYGSDKLIVSTSRSCRLIDLKSGAMTEFYSIDTRRGSIDAFELLDYGTVMIAHSDGSVIFVGSTGEFPGDRSPYSIHRILHDDFTNRSSTIRDIISLDGGGRRVASFGQDGSIVQWDWETGIPIQRFGHVGPIRCAAIANNHQFAVTGGEDGTIRFWDLTSCSNHTNHVAGRNIIATLGLNDRVVALDATGLLSVVSGAPPLTSQQIELSSMQAACISGDKTIQGVACGFQNGFVGWVNLNDLDIHELKQVSESSIRSLDISPDGQRVLVVDTSGHVFITDKSLETLSTINNAEGAIQAFFSSNGDRFAVIFESGEIRELATESLELLTLLPSTLSSGKEVKSAVSSNRKYVAVGNELGCTRLFTWDTHVHQTLVLPASRTAGLVDIDSTRRHYKRHVTDLAFCRNSEILFRSTTTRTTLFDAVSGQEISSFNESSPVSSLAIVGDNSGIIAFDQHGTAHNYGIRPNRLLSYQRKHTHEIFRVERIAPYTFRSFAAGGEVWDWPATQDLRLDDLEWAGTPLTDWSEARVDFIAHKDIAGYEVTPIQALDEVSARVNTCVTFSAAWHRSRCAKAELDFLSFVPHDLLAQLASLIVAGEASAEEVSRFQYLHSKAVFYLRENSPVLCAACGDDPNLALPSVVRRAVHQLNP